MHFFNQMDKVHSTINLLECVYILQVNVEEDTEVVHSGAGSGYVKNEEIEETDALEPPGQPVLLLKERERVARPVMHSQHLKRERKEKQTRTTQPNQT